MRRVFAAVLPAVLGTCALHAAAQTTPNRVLGPIDESQPIPLRGNVHPLAQARFDRGAAPGSTPTGRLRLVLQRSAAQQQALTQYLGDVQNPSSPVYHKWLTPAQYGTQFGISDADLARVTGWLEGHGFKIEKLPAARNAIEFSGNFGQVESAFHAAIHAFAVNGVTHFANAGDPQIPAALAPVVAGIAPLNDFRPRPALVPGPRGRFDPSNGRIEPELTLTGGNVNYLFMDPADAATVYDTPNKALNSHYTGSTTYDGSGVNLGIVGTSDLTTADIANYRVAFLGETPGAVNLPTVVVDGGAPGLNGAAIEALLDNEIAGGIAPGAKIYYYTAADTDISSGLFNALFRAVDDNVVSILSMSFGECEAGLGASGNQVLMELMEQFAAQGITVTVSTGDNGSAGCDDFNTQSTAGQGLAVSGFASTPYDIAVGGTDFDVLSTSFGTYVNASSSGTAPYYGTALKYIPEAPWNDSTSVNTTYDKNVANTSGNIIAGSGGVSTIYVKPPFQTSLTPQDRYRDLPDVALLAGNGYHQTGWVICADNTAYGLTGTFADCQTTNGQFTSSTTFGGVGGTSAAAPAFAGMMALVAQAHGSAADNYRLGQADNVLYQLAKSKYSTVFHDITTGNNSVPCTAKSPQCGGNGFLTGYNAGTGYDLASGLGSVDAAAMVANWTSVSPSTTTTTLMINSSTADYTGVHGAALKFSVAVNPSTATGVVGLVDDANETASGNQNNGQLPIPITGGVGSATYNGMPGGSYTMWARYGGDTTNAPSSSSPPIHITISAEPSTIAETVAGFDWATGLPINSTSFPYGSLIFLDGQITGTAEGTNTQGVATGSVTFTDGSATLGSAAVNSGNLASLISVGTIPGGAHSVVANYPGDASYSKSASAPVAFTVTPLATTLSGTAGPATVVANQATSIGFSGDAAWNPGLAPTGTVKVSSGSAVLASTSSLQILTGNTSPAMFNFVGSLAVNSSQLSPGMNTLTLAYGGDSNYTPSSATVQVDAVAPGGGLMLTGPSTLTVGAGGTETAPLTLSQSGGYSGYVLLQCSAGTAPVTCYIPHAHVPFTGAIDSLLIVGANQGAAAGTYQLTVVANDETNMQVGMSMVINVTVSASSSPGLAVVNNGTFNVAPGSSSGNTSFVSVVPSGGLTGQVNLSCAVTTAISNPQSAPTCTVPGSVALNASAPVPASVQVNTTSGTTPGNYSVAVTAASASNSAVTATGTVPLIVTSSASFAVSNSGSMTLTGGANTGNTATITITPLNGFAGPVDLACFVGPTFAGATGPQCEMPATVNVSAGAAASATLTLTSGITDSPGLYTVGIVAIDPKASAFGIDNTLNLQLVATPSFVLSSGADIKINPGATSGNTSTITVTPAYGFSGAVNLTCSVSPNSIANPTDPPVCSLSPNSVTINSSSAVTSTLTLTTTAPTTAAVIPGSRPSRLPVMAVLAIALVFGTRGKRRAWMRLLGLLVLMMWIAAPGCGGGGGGSSTGGGGGNPGTSVGMYSVQVTGADAATGKIKSVATVTLTVN